MPRTAMDPLSRDIRAAKRVIVNRKMVDEIALGFADGLFELARAFVTNAVVPVAAEPHRRRGGRIEEPGALLRSGGAAAWTGGKKVAEMPRRDHVKISAPRGAGVRAGTTIAVGGFGTRHAHLVEFGTVHSRATPFFRQSVMDTMPDAEPFIRLGMAKRAYLKDALRSLPTARRAPDAPRTRRALTPQERKARYIKRVVNALGPKP